MTHLDFQDCGKRFVTQALFLLLLLVVTVAGHAQTGRTIDGIVLDENGEPLPAAHVWQVGQQRGEALSAVITDVQGHFRLTVVDTTQEIEVSFLGYETRRVKLTNENSYRIVLQPASEKLSEVVVTGYQTISKERVTGAFAKVETHRLEAERLDNVARLLEGRIAGYGDGKIRGVTSMNGLTTPLYVIDGFPVEKTTTTGYGWTESVPDLNVEDIESITVLKDAAATSIYGARAANGVVVITTRRARKDRTDISFSATLTVRPYDYYTGHLADAATMVGLEREWAAMNPDLQGSGAATYAQNLLNNASYTTQGIRSILQQYAGLISQTELNSRLEHLAAQGYRYYKDVERYGKRNPLTQQYNLSLGKGTEGQTFNASFSYRSNRPEDVHSGNENFGLNLQNSSRIAAWLTLDLGTYLYYGSGATQTYSLTSPGFSYLPYDSLLAPDGSHYTSLAEERYSHSQLQTLQRYGLYSMDITPLQEMGMGLQKNKDFSNRTFARLRFTFADWLKYAASFQYEVGEYKTTTLQEKESYAVRNRVNSFASADPAGKVIFNLPYGNIFSTERNRSRAYNFRQQLDFDRTFADVHEVTAIAGMEVRENKIEFTQNTLYDYDPDLLTFGFVDAQTLSRFYGGLWGWGSYGKNDVAMLQELVNRYVSFYGNAAYTFDGKYTLTGSIRWDRTNLFATSSRYQKKPIWSVGAGWNIGKESFFSLPFVDMLKLRVSYGIGGNIAKDSAPYMTAYYSTNTQVGGIKGTISSRPNPNLRWEKTTTFNLGLDFALLGNRLSGTLEFYNKNSEDLLANTNGVPTEGWGYSTYSINNGKMRNRGIEFTLSGNVVSAKDWGWNVSTVLGYNKNKVTYVNVKAPVLFLVFDYPTEFPRVGNPYNAIYAFNWAGLSDQGAPQVYDAQGNIYATSEPTKVEDAVYQGTTVPVYQGSIGTNLRYKNWELAAQILFEGGHKMRNTNMPYLSGMRAVSAKIEDRWLRPGDEQHTDVPRYVSAESPYYNNYSAGLYAHSSIGIVDAANWRLRNLSLIYRLPQELCHKLRLKNARVLLGMENVFLLAKSKDVKWMLGGYNKPDYLCGVTLNF